jgi:hypothetical protein
MPLHELHPFQDPEIAKVATDRGVYVLYQIQIPLHVSGAENLREELLKARAAFPGASHFAVETHSSEARVKQRVADLRQQFRRVRSSAFVG